jgi:hypothetical protein
MIPQLRQLISTQSRQITYQYLLKSQPNPLVTLTGHLNPTNPWSNGPPLITTDKFHSDIKDGMADANRAIRNLLPPGEMRELVKMDAVERGKMMELVSWACSYMGYEGDGNQAERHIMEWRRGCYAGEMETLHCSSEQMRSRGNLER